MRSLSLAALTLTSLLASCGGEVSIDVMQFRVVETGEGADAATGLVPSLSIDTNVSEPGLTVRTYRSSSPYDLRVELTDPGQAIESLEITSLTITYSDGSVEPRAAELDLPVTWDARSLESINSNSKGEVVRSTVSVLDGELEGLITRDEDIRVEMRGRLLRKEGEGAAFTVVTAFEAHRDVRTVSSGTFFSDV